MYFTAQFKKSAGALTFNQIILAFVLLIVLVGQVSALPIVGLDGSDSSDFPTEHASRK